MAVFLLPFFQGLWYRMKDLKDEKETRRTTACER